MKRKQAKPSLQLGNLAHKQTICFAAGHSGGHIIPCLTMAQRNYAESSVLFFTSTKQLDCSLMCQSTRTITHIPLAITQQRHWYMLPLLAISLIWTTFESFMHLLAHMPKRIITTGSIVALPVCISGWILGIPIELFELNAQPGKTIQVLSYIAQTVRYCFTTTRATLTHNKQILTPYPIRFFESKNSTPIGANFTSDRFTLFVQGGSQGSQEINRLMQNVIDNEPELHKKIQVIHQAGAHLETIKKMYDSVGIPSYSFSFKLNLSPYYHAADLIICRAGAGALFEAVHFKKQTFIFPLITPTNDHQLHNARSIAQEYPKLFKIITARNCASILHATVNQKIKIRKNQIR